jgi:hypothetical protein
MDRIQLQEQGLHTTVTRTGTTTGAGTAYSSWSRDCIQLQKQGQDTSPGAGTAYSYRSRYRIHLLEQGHRTATVTGYRYRSKRYNKKSRGHIELKGQGQNTARRGGIKAGVKGARTVYTIQAAKDGDRYS